MVLKIGQNNRDNGRLEPINCFSINSYGIIQSAPSRFHSKSRSQERINDVNRTSTVLYDEKCLKKNAIHELTES